MKRIYLDNAASTPVDKEVAAEMVRATKLYGNPSSYNDCGRKAREYTEQARLRIARFLSAQPHEIIFTASGTEANNLAIQGVAKGLLRHCATKLRTRSNPHIITTQIEHPSVLRSIEWLSKNGFDVTYLSVNKEGFVDSDELQKHLRPETIFVSIMYANNEIGTIEPITEIGKVIKNFNNKLEIEKLVPSWSRDRKLKTSGTRQVRFHTDACQATEYLDMNVNRLGVDLLTFNGSKIYGPKGVGVLYVRSGIKLSPVILGGEQESGLRAGTENLSAIGGLAAALDRINTHSTRLLQQAHLNYSGREKKMERLTSLRDYFIENIKIILPNIVVNGPVGDRHSKLIVHRLPNNINLSVPDLTSEVLLLELDKYGICAGSGSACTSHAVEPSHVLKAIGLDKQYLDGGLRFSMGRQTTKKDIDYVLKVLPKIVRDLKKRYRKI